MTEYREILVDQIKLSPFNTRGEVPEEEIKSFADTLRQSGGNDVPIKVRPILGEQPYEVVYGERRLKALKLAGIPTARCIVEEIDDTEVLMQQWMENEEHRDISDYAKALKLRQIMDATKMNQLELAKILGKAPPWVSQHLTMLKLEGKFTRVNLHHLFEKQARAILAAPPEVFEKLCDDIKEQYLNEKTLPSASEIERMAFALVEQKLEEDAVKCDTCKHQVEGGVCDLEEGVCTYEQKTEEHVCEPATGSTHCRICDRELTDPESVKAGIGPICAAGKSAKERGEGYKPRETIPETESSESSSAVRSPLDFSDLEPKGAGSAEPTQKPPTSGEGREWFKNEASREDIIRGLGAITLELIKGGAFDSLSSFSLSGEKNGKPVYLSLSSNLTAHFSYNSGGYWSEADTSFDITFEDGGWKRGPYRSKVFSHGTRRAKDLRLLLDKILAGTASAADLPNWSKKAEATQLAEPEISKEAAPETLQATPDPESGTEEGTVKCSGCGRYVPSTLYCIVCGAPVKAGRKAKP